MICLYIKSRLFWHYFLTLLAAAFCSELVTLPWNGSEWHSESLFRLFVAQTGIPSCVLFRRRVRNRIMGVSFYFLFHGTEFLVVFSSAEGFGTEFREFSVPQNNRNSVGNNHLFRLFRLPRSYYFVRNSQPYIRCPQDKFSPLPEWNIEGVWSNLPLGSFLYSFWIVEKLWFLHFWCFLENCLKSRKMVYIRAQSTCIYRVQGSVSVFRTINPPPPLHPVSVSSPRTEGGGVHYTLAGPWGGGGSILRKTPDIGWASCSIIPLV